MVSYTTTIEQVFGSGIMVPDYGFMLNNEMTDFDATPGGVNQVEPKTPSKQHVSNDAVKRRKSVHGNWFTGRPNHYCVCSRNDYECY